MPSSRTPAIPKEPRRFGSMLTWSRWVWLLGIFFGQVSLAAAFSLGSMEILSSYGDKFLAEIELKTDPANPIRVSIGSPQDYARLNVTRPGVVDDLIVAEVPKIQGDRRVIRIVSRFPFFYPSFNLILRAEQGEGTILENYEVSADFKQGLTLKLKAERRRDRVPAAPETPVAARVDNPSIIPQVDARAAPPSPEEPAAPGGRFSKTDAPPPAVERKETVSTLEPSAPAAIPVPPAPLVRREAAAPKAGKGQPVAVPDRIQRAGAIRVPAPPPASALHKKTGGSSLDRPAPVSPLTTEPVGQRRPFGDPSLSFAHLPPTLKPLQQGDTLSAAINRMNLPWVNHERVAVALWETNRDKFIQGNIHGLPVGVELDMRSLQARFQQVDAIQAHRLLQNHWQEWKARRGRLRLPDDLGDYPNLANLLTPQERREEKAALEKLIHTWQSSWEQGDLDLHLSLYAQPVTPVKNGRDFAYWKRFKSRMFSRHQGVSLRLGPITIVRTDAVAFVGFDQWFDSNRMRSFGRKTLEIARVGETWEIRDEHFAVKQFFSKDRDWEPPEEPATVAVAAGRMKSPFVVHASTRIRREGAIQVLRELRRQGFNAYLAPLYVTPKKKIYRILVDRFSDWDRVDSLAESIRRVQAARFAAPKEFPFALKMGEFSRRQEARALVAGLSEEGLSTYLWESKGEPVPAPRRTFLVLAGGFFEKRNAERYARELEARGLSGQVTPF